MTNVETRLSSIEERIGALHTDQASVLATLKNIDEKLTSHARDQENLEARVERTLHGDGDKNIGMSVRIDRLEQAQEREKWAMRTIGAAVISLMVGAVWSILR